MGRGVSIQICLMARLQILMFWTFSRNVCMIVQIKICPRVKSGKFGHQVNSDTHLQTVEIQMRRLLMSRLFRIFIFA